MKYHDWALRMRRAEQCVETAWAGIDAASTSMAVAHFVECKASFAVTLWRECVSQLQNRLRHDTQAVQAWIDNQLGRTLRTWLSWRITHQEGKKSCLSAVRHHRCRHQIRVIKSWNVLARNIHASKEAMVSAEQYSGLQAMRLVFLPWRLESKVSYRVTETVSRAVKRRGKVRIDCL